MNDQWKIEFTENGVTRCKMEEQWLGGPKYIEVEKIRYDQLNNIQLNMLVTKIEAKIDNNILKKLIFEVSEFKMEVSTGAVPSGSLDKQILIIGNKNIPWNNFNDILKSTADWLFEQGIIQKKDLPIYVLNGSRYLLNTTPRHSNGREFDGKPYKVKASYDVYLNTNFSASDCRRQAEYLIRRFAPEVEFKIMPSGVLFR